MDLTSSTRLRAIRRSDTTTKEPKKSKFRREVKRGARDAGTATRASTAEVVGVRIGSSQIVAAVVRNTPGVPELVTLVKAPIEPGIVVAGEVREPDALALELKALFAKYKLPRKRIRLGIASSRVGVRIIEVPALEDPKLLENAIRFRAQEVVSVPLSDAILDHFVLGDSELDGAPAFRVLLAFAHRDLVDRYVEAFKKARLKVASVDFEAFALLRAVTSPEDRENADRATVALAVGQERTIFAVAEGDVCDFTRVLEWGGGSLTVAVARALNMTPSQAEPVKRTLSFGEGLEHPDLDQTQLEAARGAMQRELQVLARELLTSLQFYQSRPGSLAIGEVLLTGGGVELAGTAAGAPGAARRSGATRRSIRASAHRQEGESENRTGRDDDRNRTWTGGLSMRPVNLMTKDAASSRSLPPVGTILAGAAPIVAIGVVAVGYSLTHGTVKKDQDRLAAVQAQVAALPVAHATTPAFAAISVESNSRRSSLDSALADRFQVDSALAAIARVLPSDAWLTSLNLTSPTPADAPVALPVVATPGSTTTTTTTTTTTATTPAPTINVNAFTINGFTYSLASVARLMTQLSLLPMLSHVTLTSTATSTSGAGPTASTATLSPASAGSANAKKPKTLVQFTVNAAVNPSQAEEGT